jgi:hypothetical protein
MESYKVFILKDGPFYWTGTEWNASPFEAKCYGERKHAEKALKDAKGEKPQVTVGFLKI